MRYVDDTFVVRGHGEDNLDRFLIQLNNISLSMQYATGIEKEENIDSLFLDVKVIRHQDRILGRKLHRKPTDTDLHKESNHNPRQKLGII